MRHVACAFLVIAMIGCKKSDQVGSGVASGGSAGSAVLAAGSGSDSAGSGSAGSGSAGSGSAAGAGSGSAAAFDDKLELPKQPTRKKDEQARVDAAADALRTALATAKTAKDSAELCKAFGPLKDAMKKLQMVTAPAGIEQDFSSQRDALLQSFDESGTYCDNPSNVGVDTLRDLMSEIRKQFVTLVGMGAK